jgi:hypothetical protein
MERGDVDISTFLLCKMVPNSVEPIVCRVPTHTNPFTAGAATNQLFLPYSSKCLLPKGQKRSNKLHVSFALLLWVKQMKQLWPALITMHMDSHSFDSTQKGKFIHHTITS